MVSVQTGEILISTAVEKTILSYRTQADVFRFVDMGTKAVETEVGLAMNEPTNYAVKAAIEQSVVELIKEGERKKIWKRKENT
jgi:curli production assembly/transport component CsgG